MPRTRDSRAARPGVVGLLALIAATVGPVACAEEEEETIPVEDAPPSRHGAMRDALIADARALEVRDGDWLEDLGDAPFYGVAWLSRRAAEGSLPADDRRRLDESLARARVLASGNLLEGDLQEKVMAALGMVEHVGASGDRRDVEAIDAFLDRLDGVVRSLGDYLEGAAGASWAVRTYGPTAVTALVALLHAQYAHLVGGTRGDERRDRAVELEQIITDRALRDLVDVGTGRAARGYAFSPAQAGLFLYPNVAMMILEARLFRLTRSEVHRLQARSLHAAIQPLKLSDQPARYASPYAAAFLPATTREIATLSSQNYLTLALTLLFEITGDERVVAEADRVLDGIEALRGPWCTSQVADLAATACAPACGSGEACVASACTADRCTTGLLHHFIDGRLAKPEDGTHFCSGCNLQTLYVLGYRRSLAREPF